MTPAPTALIPASGRPLRADARRNRQRILKAARAVFADRGLHSQIDDVAKVAPDAGEGRLAWQAAGMWEER